MQTLEKSPLFTELSADESANVSGACGYYYHNPCWSPCWSSGWSSGSSSGSYNTPSNINQTTNVNVLIDD